MKKIITPLRPEEVKYFCDKHPDRESFSKIESVSWYGSEFDMLQAEINLCDECMAAYYINIKEKFKIDYTIFEGMEQQDLIAAINTTKLGIISNLLKEFL